MKIYFCAFALLALLIAFSNPAQAQRKSDFKDSLDYLLDDGIMTPEEMEEEAIGVHNRCATDINRNTYFDCACVGGAFLSKREEVGPYVEQYELLKQVYRETPECVNDVMIAGTSFQDCMDFAKISRRLETNNNEFCECVAKETVNNFKRAPSLRTQSLQNIRSGANVTCLQKFPAENRTY